MPPSFASRRALGLVTLTTLVSGCGSDLPVVPRDAFTPVDVLGMDAVGLLDAPPVRPDAPSDAMPHVTSDAMPDAMPDAVPDARIPLPDLTLLSSRMASSIFVSREFFDGSHCALNECVTAWGWRRLLRFETAALNAGDADLAMGAPDPNGPQWDYDACHMHYHYLDFANYELVDAAGTVVAIGHKQSFCLRDDLEVISGSPSVGHDCNNQGLSAGWADIYGNMLDCQYVDVTGVAPGAYQLRIELNAQHTIVESNYDNNVALFQVVLEPE